MGIEPTTFAVTVQCSKPSELTPLTIMETKGIEPFTVCLQSNLAILGTCVPLFYTPTRSRTQNAGVVFRWFIQLAYKGINFSKYKKLPSTCLYVKGNF